MIRLLCLIRCNDFIDLVGHVDTILDGLVHHKSDIRSVAQIDGTRQFSADKALGAL